MFLEKENSMKDNLKRMKGMEEGYKYMKMATCTLESFRIIRNMGQENFSGSMWVQNQRHRFNFLMGSGGEVFLMVMVFIKSIMVKVDFYLGDTFTGTFKNGLKHGLGQEYFGNGDYYKG